MGHLRSALVVLTAIVTIYKIKGCGVLLRDMGFWQYLIKSNLFRTCTLAPYSSFYFFNLLKNKEIKRRGSGCMLGT